MTIEIRELIIEARVIANERPETHLPRMEGKLLANDPKFIDGIVRRVLEVMHEQQERV